MKASELINKLNKLIEEHGDLNIYTKQDGFGGYMILELSDNVELDTLNIGEILDEGNLEPDEIKKIFTEWNGDYESDVDYETDIIVINNANILYST